MSKSVPKKTKKGTKRKAGGKVLPPENESNPEELSLATHAMSIMLCGLVVRWKNIVGYHFTDSTFNAEECRDFIYEVIQKATEIGLKVKCVVMDNSNLNLAV